MTSTTSSNKRNFSNLLRWAFYRNRVIMTILSILMLLGTIIDIYIVIRFCIGNRNVNFSLTVGLATIVLAQMASILLAIGSASNSFSFLHNKRSTDMFGAIPATRSTLFFSHLLGGVLGVAIPYAAGSLLICAVTCRSWSHLPDFLVSILIGLISIAAVYSFSVLIAYCCGTARDMGLITFAANAISIGVPLIWWIIVNMMIPGISFQNIFYTPLLTLFCPMGFAYFLDEYYFAYDVHTTAFWITIIWSLLFTAAAVILGNITAKNRRMETAQSEFNVTWLPVVVKAGASALVGGFAGLISSGSLTTGFDTVYVFSFWYILAGFATFFILHLIFSKGVRGKLMPSLLTYIGVTIVSLVLFLGMTTGLGIDTYVPSTQNISSVTFGYNGLTYSDPENIATVTEIHKIITEGLKKECGSQYYLGSSSKQGTVYEEPMKIPENETMLLLDTGLRFRYNKKLGFATDREYSLNLYNLKYYDYKRINKLLLKLYNSEEYKKQAKQFIFSEDTSEQETGTNVLMTYYEYNGRMNSDYGYEYGSQDYSITEQLTLKNDKEFTEGLRNALKEDILADPYFYYENTNEYYYKTYRYFGEYFITLNFYTDSKENTEDVSYYGRDILFGNSVEYIMSQNKFINITVNYPKTIAYLEANGYKINKVRLNNGSYYTGSSN